MGFFSGLLGNASAVSVDIYEVQKILAMYVLG
jgi:hypothetical protein